MFGKKAKSKINWDEISVTMIRRNIMCMSSDIAAIRKMAAHALGVNDFAGEPDGGMSQPHREAVPLECRPTCPVLSCPVCRNVSILSSCQKEPVLLLRSHRKHKAPHYIRLQRIDSDVLRSGCTQKR